MTLTFNKLSKTPKVFSNLTGLNIEQFKFLLNSIQNEITLKDSGIVIEQEVEKLIQKKTTKQTVIPSVIATSTSAQRELKTIFLLSSHGNKSPKSKLKDCITLFETLYEKNEQIKNRKNS